MGKFYSELSEELIGFIEKQHVFFTATAPSDDGRINLSPKGYDSLKVLNSQALTYLDYAGSGNETANHLRDNGKISLMWCSFEQMPRILRVYGYGRIIAKGTPEFFEWMEQHYPSIDPAGARQIFTIEIEGCYTSCGFGVPLMEFQGDRGTMSEWTKGKVAKGELDPYIEKHAPRLDHKHPLMKVKTPGTD